LQKHNLSVFDYKQYFGVSNQQQLADIFNNKTENELNILLLNIASSNPNNVITVGGGMPYIILGSGITADFIYPIVSIEKSNPNPVKECIFFSNLNGYARTQESFQTCQTEKYVVLKMQKGINEKEILNSINE
jgi:putative ABC transport system permease protein